MKALLVLMTVCLTLVGSQARASAVEPVGSHTPELTEIYIAKFVAAYQMQILESPYDATIRTLMHRFEPEICSEKGFCENLTEIYRELDRRADDGQENSLASLFWKRAKERAYWQVVAWLGLKTANGVSHYETQIEYFRRVLQDEAKQCDNDSFFRPTARRIGSVDHCREASNLAARLSDAKLKLGQFYKTTLYSDPDAPVNGRSSR